jgi:hypothetical protein
MPHRHKVYTYQFLQAFIILFAGLSGIANYITVNPFATLVSFVAGIILSMAVFVVCTLIPIENPISAILYAEW